MRLPKIIGYAIIIWIIPYVTAIPLMGLMNNDLVFFKTIMLVESAIVGAICTVLYFNKVDKEYFKEGLDLGLIWPLVNWLLDFAFLIPFSQMSYGRYFMEIGLRYLIIPVFTISIGYILAKKLFLRH
ncbi:MAG: hypothetical protein U9R38_06940 [Candidatus Margulisiibacteriota bacterium]|nr:hypothetical protein [Candidatus Margulisiibacteriota bacterium]